MKLPAIPQDHKHLPYELWKGCMNDRDNANTIIVGLESMARVLETDVLSTQSTSDPDVVNGISESIAVERKEREVN